MTNIKEEIKQKKFESIYQEVVINFLFTHNWYDRMVKLGLKRFGISPQQYNVLRILRGAHPENISVGYISERMIDKDSNITRLIDKLLVKKMVTREANPENRRKMNISITDEGLLKLKEIDPIVDSTMDCFKKLTDTEANLLNDLLHKIRE